LQLTLLFNSSLAMKVASLAFIILFAALTTPTAHGALRGRPGDDGYFHEENHHNEGAAPVESQKHRVLIHGPNGVPAFVKGNLGQIPGLQNLPESQVEAKAQAILQLLVNSNFGDKISNNIELISPLAPLASIMDNS
jgi:hypothetical protein